jgi:preprotein translocase subunit SecD
MAAIVLIVAGIGAVGARIWWPGAATLQAAIRFEVRLAEDHPSPGLREARIAGSDQVVYVHQEIVVTNDDIAQSSVVPGDGPSRYGVGVEFNAAGAEKMRQATASHVGRPVAILIDGDVVTAPVLRSPISTSAVISGDYTQAEAERMVNGIGIR